MLHFPVSVTSTDDFTESYQRSALQKLSLHIDTDATIIGQCNSGFLELSQPFQRDTAL